MHHYECIVLIVVHSFCS